MKKFKYKMLKNPLPLYPRNDQSNSKSVQFTDKLFSKGSCQIGEEVLGCEEDIEVINMPISSFSSQENVKAVIHAGSSSVIWKLSDNFYQSSLLNKELEYMPNPYYLQTMQPQITPSMRLILYDWMMEVCSELTLKRETFHLSVNFCDRYMSRNPNVKKEEYQLVGLTSMYLAAKIEEVLPPSLDDWASSADNGYSPSSVILMEKALLKSLGFKTTPATANSWLSWLMTQWDSFVDFHFGCVPGNSLKDFDSDRKKAKSAFEERMILMKQANQKAYKRFRETMQVLDVALLHPDSMKFLPKHLSCGLLYLMISKFFFESNYALLYYNGEECEDNYDPFRIESTGTVQELFEEFINSAAGIENIEEIYASVSFFHPFLEFESNFDLPVVCKLQSRAKLESHYEDFLSYQTHNQKNLDFVQNNLKNC
jgi:cyclin E